MTTYKYIVDECRSFEYADSFDSDWNEKNADCIAREVAEHYYSEDEGGCWNWNESISIQIFKEDGTSLGIFEVGYHLEPQFWVLQKEIIINSNDYT